jgi:hypothetical protein
MPLLTNVSIVRDQLLHPPAFGFEGVFRYPAPPESETPGTHQQLTLRVEGSTSDDFDRYHLRVDTFIRGARWRSATHALCTSLHDDPEFELRRCAHGSGSFVAKLWAFVPSTRPKMHAAAAAVGGHRVAPGVERHLLRQHANAFGHEQRGDGGSGGVYHHQNQQLRLAATVLSRMNVCNLSQPLPDRLVGAECNASVNGHVSPDALMRSQAWERAGKSDLWSVDWKSIGTMFVLAALTLPQPFTVIENGNFCGGTTGFLALLRRELCPSCPFISLDPGAYRKRRHARFSCTRDALAFAGLSSQVDFVDQPAPVIEATLPVGFVYLDGGKVRFCNSPLHATLEERMLVGSLIGLDDTWQASSLPFSVEHYGQIMNVHELVGSGDWEPLIVPPMPRVGPKAREVGNEMLATIFNNRSGGKFQLNVFPENVKQSLVRKVRSRFDQPGEREGADALRVALVERGGRELESLWLRLP